jgi:hypothetical protein
MKRLLVAVVLSAIVAVGLGRSSTLADPVDHPRADTVTVTCGGQTYTIVGPGNAGLIAGSTAVAIPAQFVFTASYTDPDTGDLVQETFVDTVGQGKRAGQQDVLTECSFSETFFDPEIGATVTINAVVTLFTTPRRAA